VRVPGVPHRRRGRCRVSRLFYASGQPVWSNTCRAYKCDWCGLVGRWGDSWQQYGSRLEEDDGNEHHLCSSDCAAKWSVRKCVDSTGSIPPRVVVLP
jgi:hypothetical protein